MKNIFRYLKTYSAQPLEVDRLIVSAFLEINQLTILENRFLLKYSIVENQIQEWNSLMKFIEIITEEIEVFDIERLIELFEFVISPEDRIVTGAIYTPKEIREYIVSETFRTCNNLYDAKIADISCGCSGFLLSAVKKLREQTQKSFFDIFNENIFGLDIQEYSITRSKLLLSLYAVTEGEDIETFNFNLHTGDALIFNWEEKIEDFQGFQIIVGNPPYVRVRNLEKSVRENLQKWEVCDTGNPDLYIPFFQIGFEALNVNGILGYITMNSFFKSLNGRALRQYFNNHQAKIKIIDFGINQIFKSKSTYTCICFIEKTEQEFIEYYKSEKKEFPSEDNDFTQLNYTILDSKKGWNLHHNDIISRIESVGEPFGEKYKTRHGIATLKNDIYIFRPVGEDENFYHLQNGQLFEIEKGICRDVLNSNKLSRNIDFESVKEKVIFPYDDNIKPKAFSEDYIKEVFPKAYDYFTHKKETLATRDKGNGNYEPWFSFGRTQSLEKVSNKLFFPKYSDKAPNFHTSFDENLMFYNGQAIVGHEEDEMIIIQKLLRSKVFWFYIENTSKPYSAGYYSLNGNYIKNFGICELNEEEKRFILSENNEVDLDKFFNDKYEIII
ncbi:MAG TPA: N-6 DNA methylase [Chryseobacterium sp.]|nr:N-6 DNA methylase [Chryseobacterium sp.]